MAAGSEDRSAAPGDSPLRGLAPTHPVSAESVSQAGAGGLLSAVGVVELALGFWAAGWWQRGGALLLAVIGATLLVCRIAAIAPTLEPPLRLVPASQPRRRSHDAVRTTTAHVPHLR
jgi:hypothetical protein